jgi:hypothetical protein
MRTSTRAQRPTPSVSSISSGGTEDDVCWRLASGSSSQSASKATYIRLQHLLLALALPLPRTDN